MRCSILGNRLACKKCNFVPPSATKKSFFYKIGSRSKQRRLLLLNDLLVCATVNGRTSEVEFAGSSGGGLTGYANERLSLKWAVPVNEVELIGGNFRFISLPVKNGGIRTVDLMIVGRVFSHCATGYNQISEQT